MPDSSTELLADVVVVALVVAHGTDADFDTRESREIVKRLGAARSAFAAPISMAELSQHVEAAVARYGRLTVPAFEALVARVGTDLPEEARAKAFGLLVGVAEADGRVSTMEQTLLRHIAEAWGVTDVG